MENISAFADHLQSTVAEPAREAKGSDPDRSSESAEIDNRPPSGTNQCGEGSNGKRARHLCPECGQPFSPVHTRQLFCSRPHYRAFHKRAEYRGGVLAPMMMAARITRGGSRGDKTTGAKARRNAEQLMDRWACEDREAGRMSMVDYMQARMKIGY